MVTVTPMTNFPAIDIVNLLFKKNENEILYNLIHCGYNLPAMQFTNFF